MEDFNNPNDAVKYLTEQSIIQYANGVYKISEDEWKKLDPKSKKAINFLCYEWDFTVID